MASKWKLSPEMREDLKDTGCWSRFVVLREGFRGAGLGPSESGRRSYGCVVGGLEVPEAIEATFSESVRVRLVAISEGKAVNFSPGGGLLHEKKEKVVKPKVEKDPVVEVEVEKYVVPTSTSGVGGERESVMWVAENLACSVVDVGTAPSSVAVGLLNWSRSNENEFWRMWSKLLPNKAQLEAVDRFKDDGREQFEILDELERDLKLNGEGADG